MRKFSTGINGYEIYSSVIHRHPITGVLHGLFMPVACVGFFLCVKAVWGARVAKKLLTAILAFMMIGWFTFEPIYSIITVAFYWLLINWAMNRAEKNKNNLFIGATMLAISVSVMEFIGHWYLEGNASHLGEFFNSVYHTPLYGVKSLLTYHHQA